MLPKETKRLGGGDGLADRQDVLCEKAGDRRQHSIESRVQAIVPPAQAQQNQHERQAARDRQPCIRPEKNGG